MKKAKFFTENWALVEEDSKVYMAEVNFRGGLGRVAFEFRPFSNRYDEIGDFDKTGIAIVKLDGVYGLINERGKEICKPQYEGIRPIFSKYYHVYSICGKSYIIDAQGKIMCEYDSIYIHDGCEELAMAMADKEWNIINSECCKINKRKYDEFTFLSDCLLEVKIGNTLIIVNFKGEEVFEIEDGTIYKREDGYFGIRTNRHNKHGLLTLEGKLLIPIEYKSVSNIKDNKFTALIEVKNVNSFLVQDFDKNGTKIGKEYWINY